MDADLLNDADAIGPYIESLINLFVDAINKHDFSPSSPAYSHLGPHFRITPLLTLHGAQSANLTLDEWLAGMEQNHKPHHRFETVNFTTYVDVRRGRTEVFGNCRGSIHPGIYMPIVSYYLFTRYDEDGGSWKCDRIRITRGIEADPFG